MPQRAWSARRERRYEHMKEGLVERGIKGRSQKSEAQLEPTLSR
jgi:hypothetical protein